MKKILICAAVLLAAGCAKRPEEIMATPVSVDPYMQMGCAQLAGLKMQKDAELAKLEKAQDGVARYDAAAMVIVHVPISKISGADKSEELARVKGEAQAIGSAYQSKNCAAG
jgi:hypothetical protein